MKNDNDHYLYNLSAFYSKKTKQKQGHQGQKKTKNKQAQRRAAEDRSGCKSLHP